MKIVNKFSLLSIITLTFLTACVDDSGELTVTYNKGTAIYGDMEKIRQVPLLGTVRGIENPGKIFVASSYLLIGEEDLGIHIIDNSNPSQPTPSGFINIPGNKEFFFEDNIIYAESYYDMLKIEISNPSLPMLLSRSIEALSEEIKNDSGESLLAFSFVQVTEKVNDKADVYDQIYGGVHGYTLYDFANNLIPPSAVPASFAGNSNNKIGSINRIVKYNDFVYVVSRSNLLAFDDQNDFEKVFHQQMGSDMETVFPMQDYLFIGSRDRVSIMDISTPESPTYLSHFWHTSSCDPVYPTENNVAYVTLRTGDFAECPGDVNALIVLNTLDIQRPVSVQEIEMISPFGLQKIGTKLYVGEGANGLKIFDASEPEHLKLEQWIKEIEAYDILEHPTNAGIILIAGPEGLSQYEKVGDFALLSKVQY
ncbi:MAG: hypothetical protein ACJA08_001926 [Cyclobacteriaceae bacterium]|jgi:hypothetical protein